MSSLSLFDLAAGAGDPTRLAERLVDAALGSLRYLQELDATFAPAPGRVFDRQAAGLLRSMYEEWGRDSGSVLERVHRVEKSGGRSVEGASRLRDGHGRVMAMLNVTIEDIDLARDQIRRGETFTVEEVRRELLAASHR
jgi:hypothetical protein